MEAIVEHNAEMSPLRGFTPALRIIIRIKGMLKWAMKRLTSTRVVEQVELIMLVLL